MPSQPSKISNVDALWTLIQGQTKAVRKARYRTIVGRASTIKKKKEAQQAMVKESLTRAFNELNSGNVHHDARRLFKD